MITFNLMNFMSDNSLSTRSYCLRNNFLLTLRRLQAKSSQKQSVIQKPTRATNNDDDHTTRAHTHTRIHARAHMPPPLKSNTLSSP